MLVGEERGNVVDPDSLQAIDRHLAQAALA